ncbi:MAG TPA: adenosylmethionine decarboxylase [Desulfurococcales archaeon]|nr:adenosylmethionine decarboxylase [Desulfurococcales archaeon]
MVGLGRISQKYSAEAKVVGKHIYGNLYDCDYNVLTDEERLRQIAVKAAQIGCMTLLDVKSWKIGLGVSVLAVVLESHIAIHTWPEYNFATVDVYTCGAKTKPEEAFNFIVKELKAKKVVWGYADRSYLE